MRYGASRAFFTERFPVAMSPRDRAALKQLSAMTGETQSVVVRRLIRQEAQRRGVWPTADRPAEAPEVSICAD